MWPSQTNFLQPQRQVAGFEISLPLVGFFNSASGGPELDEFRGGAMHYICTFPEMHGVGQD